MLPQSRSYQNPEWYRPPDDFVSGKDGIVATSGMVGAVGAFVYVPGSAKKSSGIMGGGTEAPCNHSYLSHSFTGSQVIASLLAPSETIYRVTMICSYCIATRSTLEL